MLNLLLVQLTYCVQPHRRGQSPSCSGHCRGCLLPAQPLHTCPPSGYCGQVLLCLVYQNVSLILFSLNSRGEFYMDGGLQCAIINICSRFTVCSSMCSKGYEMNAHRSSLTCFSNLSTWKNNNNQQWVHKIPGDNNAQQ
jgi:hypothetical protein